MHLYHLSVILTNVDSIKTQTKHIQLVIGEMFKQPSASQITPNSSNQGCSRKILLIIIEEDTILIIVVIKITILGQGYFEISLHSNRIAQ